MNNNLLILGGCGFIGSALCEKPVRLSHARHLQPLPTVEIVEADLYDDDQLARLVAGRDAVVNLIGILHGREQDFERVHAELPRRLALACLAAGTRRVIHMSALGVGRGGEDPLGRPALDPHAAAHHHHPIGEAALLQQPGLAVTCLRPSVVFGAGDRFINLFATLQAFAPLVPLAGAAARFQPVWVEDLAEAILCVLDDPATAGQTLECAGPRVYTLAELVRLAGCWSGHRRWVWPLPSALAWPMAWCMEWMPGGPLMSRDNLLSMEVPNVASGHRPGLESLGITPTPLEAIGPGMLGGGGELARLDRWRAKVLASS